MTREQKIEALAKLDGFENVRMNDRNLFIFTKPFLIGDRDKGLRAIPDYLHSYDAILPLVQKQDEPIKERMAHMLCDAGCNAFHFDDTPEQIADALLRAKGLL